jgi:DNA-directed RNA polymerase I, II, and III subunit RPABC2
MLLPSKWELPSKGNDLIIVPTVLGDRCRFKSQDNFIFPSISKINCFLETDSLDNFNLKMIRLYNVLREFLYLSNPEEPKLDTPESETLETEADPNLGLNKALDTYRKLIEKNVTNPTEPLTDKEQSNLENRIKEIESREVVEKVEEHEAVEIPCEKDKITIGPPTLTRFEKARIMGARALQLSLGAPPFIEIPKDARISLDISMEELEKKVIPITIRRVLPNGDYQNIPIDYFQ